ncbi:MAG: hypothetical protein DMF39_12010 [Verrucomicrobia bacterium]|nr:MAG: hypothetical protein DMF39_12010 [Verrucomicrobiota bacterium]
MSAPRYACILFFGAILSGSAAEAESPIEAYFSPGFMCCGDCVRNWQGGTNGLRSLHLKCSTAGCLSTPADSIFAR